ncbi:Neurofilament medium polypeptide [Paramuricea clavata]|uniref:Neurofilament medium polypeptide n=1 Tax=Paramuricea clavata TaxID=317549 RepID=A0A6S7JSU0_PARCT|nr:Neurofilament medium polypeptide [Paramuricea clavata]
MSKEYCDAMQNATVVPDVRHLQIRWQEERFKTKKWEGGPESQTNIAEEYHTHQKEVCKDDELRWDDSSSSGSDNDCDDNENDVTVEDIPTATMPVLLAEFEDWFLSPDGGKRDEKTVKQHSSQLYSLLKVIDDEEDMQSLLDVKLVRQVFFEEPQVNAAREKVKLWSASYKRESSERKWQKLEEDMLNRLTPGNIRSFEKSQTAREAVKIIGKHSDNSQTTVVTQQSYTLVRDFLFTQIFIDNANRPGVLAGMTIDEYKRMTKQDDSYIITVLKHKTSHVHGPARLVLSSKLKSWLSVFVEVMRPQIASATCGNVFLTWSGKGMISGHITKAVQSVFKKSGINVKVTSTSFRKAAVTAVHSGKPTFSGKLARHMAHSETTAKKYYLLTEKTKESVETSKELGELMRCDGEEQQDSGKKGDSETRDKEDTAGETECATNQKGEWNDSDFEKVRTIFGKDIAAKTITMERVREGIESNEELYGMSPRRIYDKIRKTINKESASLQNIPELPQTCESLEDKLQRFEECSETVDEELSTSIIQPSERNSNFTNEEMNSLQKMFKDMITEDKKICRIEIEKRLSTNKEGENILKKLSVQKVVNRVKYERRKHRQQPK